MLYLLLCDATTSTSGIFKAQPKQRKKMVHTVLLMERNIVETRTECGSMTMNFIIGINKKVSDLTPMEIKAAKDG